MVRRNTKSAQLCLRYTKMKDYQHTGVSQLRLYDVAFRSPMIATNHAIAIKSKLKLL